MLHFLVYDVTVNCIDSICQKCENDNYEIIIVDNGSNNGSGKKLKDKYQNEQKIHVLISNDNKGFAKGNNIGYRYAKKECNADFIIMMNNDTEMIQDDFVKIVIDEFEKHQYFVLGPDIINLEGTHQSPQRLHIVTKSEVLRWLLKRIGYTVYLKYVKVTPKVKHPFLTFYRKREHRRIANFEYKEFHEMVEIQGACIVFSPLYLKNSNVAFLELSFMYIEESTLAYVCKKNNWKIIYNPLMRIRHMEKMSTKKLTHSEIDKEIFFSENNVKSLKALYKIM